MTTVTLWHFGAGYATQVKAALVVHKDDMRPLSGRLTFNRGFFKSIRDLFVGLQISLLPIGGDRVHA